MPDSSENVLTFRSLHTSALVSVRQYRCRAGRGGPAGEEYSGHSSIVITRQGAFCKHFGRRSVTADANQAMFFSQGSTYRVSHPADCGDRGTTLEPAPQLLADVLRELDSAAGERPPGSFPFVAGPVPAPLFWRHHEFVRRLRTFQAGAPDPVWADGTAIPLIADIVSAAYAHLGSARLQRRTETDADHAERAEAAKRYLSGSLGARITLEQVAQFVDLSPFHLCRVFRQQTGMPVHRYLNQLRLRASLERLADGESDLTRLALGMGFSSHSHFTDAFRRQFGCTPSHFRQDARARSSRGGSAAHAGQSRRERI
jgi:AraC-like DNA-binding protein